MVGGNQNKKPWYIKWWFYILIVLFWFLLPKAIDIIYLAGLDGKQPNTTLSSSDIVVYIGSFCASIITLVAVKIGANHSKKLQDDSIIANASPCISINLQPEKLALINSNIDISKLKPGDEITFTPVIDDPGYINADKRYFFIIENGIKEVDSLKKEQERKLGTFIVNSNNTVENKTQLLLIKLINVGKDAAVNFYPALYRIGTKNRIPSLPTVFPLNSIYYIAIYFTRNNNEYGDYILEFHYEDIYGNRYRQSQPITIYANGVEFQKSTCFLVKNN